MRRSELKKLIKASGLSVEQFARTIVLREPRTVFRWLAGDSPIPKVVVKFLRGCRGLK